MATVQYPQYSASGLSPAPLASVAGRFNPSLRQVNTIHVGKRRLMKNQWLFLMLLSLFIFITAEALPPQTATEKTVSSGSTPAAGLGSQLNIQKKISGVITDYNGVPIMGVIIQTIPAGTVEYSDARGNFSILISQDCQQLVFIKNGYTQKTLANKDVRPPLKIQLTRDNTNIADSTSLDKNLPKSLSEVVIIGYGKASNTRTKKSHEPAAVIPASQMITPNNTTTLSSALQGRVAGLLVSKDPNRAALYGNFPANDFAESYAHEKEGGFKSPQSSPLSTFSIDVDKASYSNIRRFIQQGNLPPSNAVRIEELINYFDYQYQQPKGQDPVAIQTELSQAPWNPRHYLLQVGLQAKKVATDQLPASNLVFLIDVSGSMNEPGKLPLLVSAFKMLTDQLRAEDHVSIVTYAGNAQDVLAPTSGSHKQQIKTALDGLRAWGSTNGAGGLEKAYQMAEKHFNKNGNNRIILASDGDFNVGATSLEDLEKLITEKRKSGIFLSVLGFGMGNYKDDKMELLADKGNGNYAYIDNSAEARRVLLKEFGGTLFTIAKDVKVQVEFNPDKVEAYRLIGYENRALADEDFNQDTVDAGEMGSGSTVTALYEIIPKGLKDAFTPAVDSLRYGYALQSAGQAASVQSAELGLIKIRYKTPAGQKSKLIRQLIADSSLPLASASGRFQLAAAAASWGMLLKNSDYKQSASYDEVEKLIQKPLAEDKTGQIGQFLTLVQTSQALIGNEVQGDAVQKPPVIRPVPRPFPLPRRHRGLKEAPPVAKIIPAGQAATGL